MKNKPKQTDEERLAFMREIASRGGKARSKSNKAHYPFRDTPGLAKKAGSTSGYTFKRKKKDSNVE